MKAIILAAGYATRMYPLTHDKAKALLPLYDDEAGSVRIIDTIVCQIDTLPTVSEIVVVSNHKFIAQFDEWAKTPRTSLPITVLDDGSTDDGDKLGAIGDINFALDRLNISEDIVVIAGDNYFTYPLVEQYSFFQKMQKDIICAKQIDNPELLPSMAVAVLDANGRVLELEEKPKQPKSNIGIFATYFYKAETLPLIKQYLKEGNNPDAPGYFPMWLHKQKDIYAYVMNGECYDLGTIAAYEELRRALNS